MSYELKKPITDKEKADFIVEYNHKNGLKIEDTEMFLFALEPNEMMGEKEIEIDVPDYDEDGNPIMIEIEVEVPIYNEGGEIIGYEKVKKQIQKTHKETVKIPYPVINPDYEEEEAEKERKRIDALKLTPSDVERALYYGKNMDFDDLKELIKVNAPTIDIKALGIELRANNFYRGAVDKDGNRIVDMIGALLGYTSADMDYLFINKKLPEKEQTEVEE